MSYEKMQSVLGMPIAKCVTAHGEPHVMMCDGRCDKAWGMNSRPSEDLDPNNPDDFVWLSDSELGEAPECPGTSEGGEYKPQKPEFRLNKWCYRECERSREAKLNAEPISPRDWSKRVYNIPRMDDSARTTEVLQ